MAINATDANHWENEWAVSEWGWMEGERIEEDGRVEPRCPFWGSIRFLLEVESSRTNRRASERSFRPRRIALALRRLIVARARPPALG